MKHKVISTIKSQAASNGISDLNLQIEILSSALSIISNDYRDLDFGYLSALIGNPNAMRIELEALLGPKASWIQVTGTIDERVVIFGLSKAEGIVVSLCHPISYVDQRHSLSMKIVRYLNDYIGVFICTEQQVSRLCSPKTLLVGLYHPETFPMPRLHLGISDLARALRTDWLGTSELMDMQLNTSMSDIKQRILSFEPDIIGISATFGQYDLLIELLEFLAETDLGFKPLIITGGSLAAHLQTMLVKSKKTRFVSVGAGEGTIAAVARFWLSEIPVEEIPDVAYIDEGLVKVNSRVSNRNAGDIIPELDLLDSTLSSLGVMQLESSRGCSYACSFCPRSHKGIWAGEHPTSLEVLMPYIARSFESYPHVHKRIFLVDEEFVGYQTEELALGRCMDVAELMSKFGFRFETSSRIDQVFRPRKDRSWHLNRMRFWTDIKNLAMERCLFGVESGVDSILKRFNKKTTARQNIIAIRLLSLMEIPIRYTYITFDPLMSMSELTESLAFLSRTDLAIKRPQHVAADDYGALFDIALDDNQARVLSSETPFYMLVSYLGVSMEALIGSPYLNAVEAADLAGDMNPLMGRRESRYLDPVIGKVSSLSQRWVDRNFTLDYTLKSIQKRLPSAEGKRLNAVRITLKKCAHDFINLSLGYVLANDGAQFSAESFLNEYLESVIAKVIDSIDEACLGLSKADASILRSQLEVWCNRSGWGLINGQCD